MSALPTTKIFDLNLINAERPAVVEQLLSTRGQTTVAFVNAHCVNVAARDRGYCWALSRADFLLPDGSGIQIAARLRGQRFVENLNGTDLFVPLMRAAAEKRLSVFLFGGRPGVAERAASVAQQLAPGLDIAGTAHGYQSRHDADSMIDRINESGAEVVIVALGVPLQELWIARNRHRLSARLILGVGAQLDFWSGEVQRAPLALRKLGLEWTWRLLLEPKRMFTRYVLGNPVFLLRAFSRFSLKQMELDWTGRIIRILDVLVASSLLFVLSPGLIIIALMIRLDSRGPVLFKQIRIGENGRAFVLYKFRSMHVIAGRVDSVPVGVSDRPGVCFKVKKDNRVTNIGRWIRRFSLDEIPQLLNVLRGDMTLVGPRPGLPQEVTRYTARALKRLRGKPGLTGLWQVSGRADISFDRMVEMDIACSGARTLPLYIMMLALTIRAVVGGRGAY